MTHLQIKEGQGLNASLCEHDVPTDYSIIHSSDHHKASWGSHIIWCSCGRIWVYDATLGAIREVYDFEKHTRAASYPV